jgi:hypothetical protein
LSPSCVTAPARLPASPSGMALEDSAAAPHTAFLLVRKLVSDVALHTLFRTAIPLNRMPRSELVLFAVCAYCVAKKIIAQRFQPESRRLRYVLALTGARSAALDGIGRHFCDSDSEGTWCSKAHAGTACTVNASECVVRMLRRNSGAVLLFALWKCAMGLLRLRSQKRYDRTALHEVLRRGVKAGVTTTAFLIAITLAGWGTTCSLARLPKVRVNSTNEDRMVLMGVAIATAALALLEPIRRRRSHAIFMLLCLC